MSPRFRQSLMLLSMTLAFGYFVYVLVLMTQQSRVIFAGQGIPMTKDLREEFPLANYTTLKSITGDVHACYLESDEDFNDGPIPIVAHGNAETIGHWSEISKSLLKTGLSILLVEYPGYGGSEGVPSQASTAETFDHAYAWLEANHRLTNRKIIGIGRSIGSGPIVELTGRHRLDGLVLISPFSTLRRMAWGMGAPGFLLKTKYDNVAGLKSFHGPTLLFHGTKDHIIPPSHSNRLTKTNARVALQTLEVGHNDIWEDPDVIVEHLKTWLAEHDLWKG
ncbi:MAG: pimeloyl-ACP methyl ester carboxylesterase [Verrucomicrobiales bacterium]|jgi:pimeloyl-ACP methyl ester carboxylesterase